MPIIVSRDGRDVRRIERTVIPHGVRGEQTGVNLPVNALKRAPEIPVDRWRPHLDDLETAIREAVEAVGEAS